MNEITVIFKMVLGMIFLSASISKFSDIRGHIYILEEFRILPIQLVSSFGWVDAVLEFVVGVSFILGIYQFEISLLSIGLLLIYCFAIILNFYRGRTEISCGCGGVAGNHKLSKLLVYRNFLLIIFCTWLLWFEPNLGNFNNIVNKSQSFSDVYSFKFFSLLFISSSILLMYSVTLKLLSIKKQLMNLIV